jgi:hypothetical protein
MIDIPGCSERKNFKYIILVLNICAHPRDNGAERRSGREPGARVLRKKNGKKEALAELLSELYIDGRLTSVSDVIKK